MPTSYGRNTMNTMSYLRELNKEPAVDDVYGAVDEEQVTRDMEIFTNTTFYDHDNGQTTDFQATAVKPETYEPASATSDVNPLLDDFSVANLDFLSGDFNFGDFTSTYTSPTIPTFQDTLNLQPIQPNPQSDYPQHVPQQHQPGYVPNPGAVPPHQARTGSGGVDGVGVNVIGWGLLAGEKRKAEHVVVNHTSPPNRMLSFEEQSRLAAEEDKRKRNTAASARFRVKKKQREQALEKSAKEMTEKVTLLESRISALETENKWLKSLVTEKHGGGNDDILKKLLKEFSAAQENGKGDHKSESGDDVSRSSSRGGTSSASSSVASSITAVPAGGDEIANSNPSKKKRKD